MKMCVKVPMFRLMFVPLTNKEKQRYSISYRLVTFAQHTYN